MDSYDPVLVRIVLPKGCRQSIQNYTALDKIIEQNRTISISIKLSNKRIVKTVRQPISKRRQRRFELILVDVSRVVRIERPEAVLPIRYVLPEGSKVLEAYLATIAAIKHPNHEPDRLRVERVPRSVREGLLQLVLRDEPAPVAINLLEDVPEELLVWHAGHSV